MRAPATWWVGAERGVIYYDIWECFICSLYGKHGFFTINQKYRSIASVRGLACKQNARFGISCFRVRVCIVLRAIIPWLACYSKTSGTHSHARDRAGSIQIQTGFDSGSDQLAGCDTGSGIYATSEWVREAS